MTDDFKTTRTAPMLCPNCAKFIDAHTCTEGDKSPVDGDISLCLYCHTVSVFDKGAIRAMTHPEWLALTDDERAQIAKVLVVMKRHPVPDSSRNQ